jgi:hypothetical protein
MKDLHNTSVISKIAYSTIRILLVSSVFTFAIFQLPNLKDPHTIATALIAVPGMLIGFLLTAISLLVAAADNPFLVNLRRTGHFSTLVENLSNSSLSWVIVLCMAFLCHLLEKFNNILAFSISMMFYSLIYFAMSMYRFKQVIMSISKP